MFKPALLRAALLASACSFGATSPALAQQQTQNFDIAPGDLAPALEQYMRQASVELVYSRDAVTGKTTQGVRGSFSREEALQRLLAGSGLQSRRDASGAILVADAISPTRLGAAEAAPSEQPDEEIVVTGTRIRGAGYEFSPVQSATREELDQSGFRSAADYTNSLPQNFGGGVQVDAQSANSSTGPGASGVNLRGLGPESTLVLVNGRRIAPVGLFGRFADLSSIPVSAIDRVEVVTDGASAIYGSDAVAGVVNIILRDDFNGGETRTGLGTITDGGGASAEFAQTLGYSDDRSHGLITYEYSTEDALRSTDRDFARSAIQPTDLLPLTQTNSVLAAGGFEISPTLRLSGEAYWNERKSKQSTSSNTLFLFQAFQEVDVEQASASVGLQWDISENWTADLSGGYASSSYDSGIIRLDPTGNDLSDSAQADVASFDATLGGPLFSITNAPVRGVVGVHFRTEQIDASSENSTTHVVFISNQNEREVFAAFGEIYAPVVGEANHMPGIERLSFSVAARYEDYDDIGSTLNPRLGFAWSPMSDLAIRGTYSTSFRAPRLDQLIAQLQQANLSIYIDPESPSGESVALGVFGSTGDLGPEESTSRTIGFDFDPAWMPGLHARATYFDIDYDNRIANAVTGFGPQFQFQDYTGIPERNPSPERVQELRDAVPLFFNVSDFFPSLGTLTLADVETILFIGPQNTATTAVDGVDFEISYDATDEWRLFFAGTKLFSFDQQFSSTEPVVSILDTYANPIALRLRGGVHWQTPAASASVFLNYTGSYTDDRAPSAPTIDAWTTVDASLGLNLGEIWHSGALADTALTFSVRNLLNEDPPAIGTVPSRADLYDASNADPSGRRVGLVLTKRW